ncbi:hypothetical protein I317_05933 [Kwoniella heveanensis CBS 569]|nr:hypothetical protein I317_05933 [Kwoniella heveanensis CBS 569]
MLAGIGLVIISVASFSWLGHLTSSASHQISTVDWDRVSNSTKFLLEHMTETVFDHATAINYTELPDQAKKLLANQTGIVKDAFVQIDLENEPQVARNYVKEHPGQVAIIAVHGLVFIAPELLTVPLMEALGFARLGPVARSAAAAAQAAMKKVPAGSWFSIFQSARMGGYGLPIVNGAVRDGTGLWAGLSWVWGKKGQAEAASAFGGSPAGVVGAAKMVHVNNQGVLDELK